VIIVGRAIRSKTIESFRMVDLFSQPIPGRRVWRGLLAALVLPCVPGNVRTPLDNLLRDGPSESDRDAELCRCSTAFATLESSEGVPDLRVASQLLKSANEFYYITQACLLRRNRTGSDPELHRFND